MDGFKALSVFFLALLIPAATAISFDASVRPNTSFSAKNFEYDQEAEGLQEANVTVLNTGSVGCKFQMKAVFNDSKQAYSEEKALWPGTSAFLEVRELFDEEGLYEADVLIEYCGQTERLRNFSFSANGTEINDSEVVSETLGVGSERANVSVQVDEGLLIPFESPPYWQVSSSKIVNGTASLSYQPTIFDDREKIRYSIYNRSSGEMKGFTTVSLDESASGKWEKRIEFLRKHFLEFLTASVLMNLLFVVLFFRRSLEEKTG